MRELMDLKVDFAFKQMFGRRGNETILIAFLNAALGLSTEERIVAVEFLSPEFVREHAEDKAAMLDVHVRTDSGARINIEIQLMNKYDMEMRTLYYWSRIYTDQMDKGMDYVQLKPTITINIMNFRRIKETDRFHTVYRLYEEQEKHLLTDMMEIHYMEIPKLMEQWRAQEISPREDELARWLMMLEADEDVEIRSELEEIAMEDPVIKKAFEVWEELSRDKKKRMEYELRLKAMLDEAASERQREVARQQMELTQQQMELTQQRLEEAEKRLEQAEKQGKSEIAQNLLSMGIDIETIIKATGLPEQDILRLKTNTARA